MKSFQIMLLSFLEPLELSLNKKYFLNVVKEITVKDSFLSMNKDLRGCQEESFEECSTRQFLNDLLGKCQCLPFQVIQNNKVCSRGLVDTIKFLIFRLHVVLQKTLNVFQASKLTTLIVFNNVLVYRSLVLINRTLRTHLRRS